MEFYSVHILKIWRGRKTREESHTTQFKRINDFQFLAAELNLFYLKFILWIPPPHFIMQARMALYLGMGAVALNETYRYMDDP